MLEKDRNILLIILAVIVIFFLLKGNREGLETGDAMMTQEMPPAIPPFVAPETQPVVIKQMEGAEPSSTPNSFASPMDTLTLDVNLSDPANAKYAMQAPEAKPKLTASDLLPGYSKESWFDNPDVGIKVEDANLMADAITKIGVDTVGTTQKNPAYDLRGTIPCPKFVTGPWNNSTIEPDINLKSLY